MEQSMACMAMTGFLKQGRDMAHHLLTVKRVRAVMIVMFPRHSASVDVWWMFVAAISHY